MYYLGSTLFIAGICMPISYPKIGGVICIIMAGPFDCHAKYSYVIKHMILLSQGSISREMPDMIINFFPEKDPHIDNPKSKLK